MNIVDNVNAEHAGTYTGEERPSTISNDAITMIAEIEELRAKLDRAQAEIRALESKLLEREVRS